MILIADSGSTKADWVIIDGEEVFEKITTKGLNPYFETNESVYEILMNTTAWNPHKEKIKQVYFYGAGCSSEARCAMIAQNIQKCFSNAQVFVDHDMLGAALSVCKSAAGIVCILGTGSNCCYFDGQKITDTIGGMGYVVGDEASGAYFGKRLLRDYSYEKLPEDIRQDLEFEFDISREIIIKKVYVEGRPSSYLASFMPFIGKHREQPYVRRLLKAGLGDFLDTNVIYYPDHQQVPVHFVGSIGYYFEDLLREVSEHREIQIGKIIKKPIFGLVDFFKANPK